MSALHSHKEVTSAWWSAHRSSCLGYDVPALGAMGRMAVLAAGVSAWTQGTPTLLTFQSTGESPVVRTAVTEWCSRTFPQGRQNIPRMEIGSLKTVEMGEIVLPVPQRCLLGKGIWIWRGINM